MERKYKLPERSHQQYSEEHEKEITTRVPHHKNKCRKHKEQPKDPRQTS